MIFTLFSLWKYGACHFAASSSFRDNDGVCLLLCIFFVRQKKEERRQQHTGSHKLIKDEQQTAKLCNNKQLSNETCSPYCNMWKIIFSNDKRMKQKLRFKNKQTKNYLKRNDWNYYALKKESERKHRSGSKASKAGQWQIIKVVVIRIALSERHAGEEIRRTKAWV